MLLKMLIYRHKLRFFVEICLVFSALITFFNNLLYGGNHVTLKKLVTLIAVSVAGFFLYHYFIPPSEEEYCEAEEIIPAHKLPSVPETCQSKVQEFKKAIYGHGSHQASAAQLNRKQLGLPFTKPFLSDNFILSQIQVV